MKRVSNSKETIFLPLKGKAMRWPEISVIPCFAKINLNGIPTVGNLTEINFGVLAELSKLLTERIALLKGKTMNAEKNSSSSS